MKKDKEELEQAYTYICLYRGTLICTIYFKTELIMCDASFRFS